MKTILMVPIRVDALYVGKDENVVEAMADFSRLPYKIGEQKFNDHEPYISENIVSQPFQNKNLTLRQGIHLHWALPDALTKGVQNKSGTTFPVVPNRWLVTRILKEGQRDQWIVESDYLWPEGEKPGDVVNIFYPAGAKHHNNQHNQPFRYLGRKFNLKDRKLDLKDRDGDQEGQTVEYLERLTAVGYGEPTFAAFYPNCRTVFGFHEQTEFPKGSRYEVIGWYSDPKQDILQDKEILNSEDLLEALKQKCGWTFSLENNEPFPEQSLYYGQVVFKTESPQEDPAFKINDPSDNITVAIGNTGTEALSAYLADQIDSNNKANIEDQLEAIQFSEWLEQRELDIGPKFEEARHEKGFMAVPSGILWTIRPETSKPKQPMSPNDIGDIAAGVPEELQKHLNELNELQRKYDCSKLELESMRRQLFADWYKYMLTSYHEPDDEGYPEKSNVTTFLGKAVVQIYIKESAIGMLELGRKSDTGPITHASYKVSKNSLASKLAGAINGLINQINNYKSSEDEGENGKTTYTIGLISAPRYWRPKEPVVLVTGNSIKPTPRHGQDNRLREDGLLECDLLEIQESSVQEHIASNLDTIKSKIESIKAEVQGEHIAFNDWNCQPWHPFLLEWEVSIDPEEIHPEKDASDPLSPENFINNRFELPDAGVDLSMKESGGNGESNTQIFDGRCILTPYAGSNLEGHIKVYLTKHLLKEYYEAKEIPDSDRSDDFLDKNIQEILNWYKDKNSADDTQRTQDPLYTALRAFNELLKLDCLSQALGGFNEAMLMRKLTMQLDIDDPLGSEKDKKFAGQVHSAVGDCIGTAPSPQNAFNPLRTGTMKLDKARLVDTFGRVKEFDKLPDPIVAEPLRFKDNGVLLRPRFAQGARLNFRWLPAAKDTTSFICGWVLPNHLDNSLIIYNAKGMALGSINQNAEWRPAPGKTEIKGITNGHLQRMLELIRKKNIDTFIETLESAYDQIEPESFTQHSDPAFLTGRPLALVRASISLELRGLPAVHEGWKIFKDDMKNWEDWLKKHDSKQVPKRNTYGFTKVSCPVRIGDNRQFNDGLIGYWREKEEGEEDQTFYSPNSKSPCNVSLSVNDTQIFSMLIDPRGKVHAVSGILPVKAIEIPADQYADALRNMEVTFLTAPVLTPRDNITLPLSPLPGLTWSWLAKDEQDWIEISAPGKVAKSCITQVFGEGVWKPLIDSGWIKEIEGEERALILPKDQRNVVDLEKEWKDRLSDIELFLDRFLLGTARTGAVFTGPQEIREGWLKLCRTKGSQKD